MGTDSPSLEEARRGLADALALEDGMQRRLGVAAAIQTAVSSTGLNAVVVGGAAVEYWLHGEFSTADVDLLLPSDERVASLLADLGLERRTGRHWWDASGRVAVELPGEALEPQERAVEVEGPTGLHLHVLAMEDALVRRLHEFAATGHYESAVQAIALLKAPRLNSDLLARRIAEENLERAHLAISELGRRVDSGETLETWDVHEASRTVRAGGAGES